MVYNKEQIVFGYLQIQKSELLVREFEAYKSVYCGLCKQMGKDYSFLTRLSLSYDCTFYAMLLMSVSRSCKGFKDGRCTFNPLKKCKFALCESDCYSKASAFSVISVFYKLKDDLADEGFFRRILTRFLLLFFSHWQKIAAKKYPDIDKYISEMTSMQAEAEADTNCSVDMAAHPTGYMLANVFALEAENDTDRRIFYEFGYHLGRWIYFVDAADDIEKDKKKHNFNPFISLKEEYTGDRIVSALNQSLARAYDAYNLIDIKDFRGILDNMLLLGLPSVQNKVTGNIVGGNNE